jgi:hypothetical protein
MVGRDTVALLLTLLVAPAVAGELKYKDRLLGRLVQQVPGLMSTYDAQTGRFGKGIWLCNDQEVMYPLAVAYATPGAGNTYYKDSKLLAVIGRAGEALIDDMDAHGAWEFRKKDGSTWGKIRMPWTYSRWIRSYALVRDDLPAAQRERWTQALTLGYTEIARSDLHQVHNIPTHHAMGLYAAGKILGRPAWCQQAASFMARVVAAQNEGGYWAEGGGPVVGYDFVYLDALGTYCAMSGDRSVLPALAKGALFHARFTYPSGQSVETLDQRNPYHDRIEAGNVAFTFTPEGRAYLAQQWQLLDGRLSADLSASLLLYGVEGSTAVPPAGGNETFVLREAGVMRAATVRRGPWFVCLSAYTAPLANSRWHQDRQNLASIWHEKTGLLLGGGNTKLQPGWSTITVGDESLLQHRAGDTKPDFRPKGSLFHIPRQATLTVDPRPGLTLDVGPERCTVGLEVQDSRHLVYTVERQGDTELPAAAHLTLLPRVGWTLTSAAGRTEKLGLKPIAWDAKELRGNVGLAPPSKPAPAVMASGFRLRLPTSATLRWPVLPHNPYRADGHATLGEGRIEIRIPLAPKHAERVVLEIE